MSAGMVVSPHPGPPVPVLYRQQQSPWPVVGTDDVSRMSWVQRRGSIGRGGGASAEVSAQPVQQVATTPPAAPIGLVVATRPSPGTPVTAVAAPGDLTFTTPGGPRGRGVASPERMRSRVSPMRGSRTPVGQAPAVNKVPPARGSWRDIQHVRDELCQLRDVFRDELKYRTGGGDPDGPATPMEARPPACSAAAPAQAHTAPSATPSVPNEAPRLPAASYTPPAKSPMPRAAARSVSSHPAPAVLSPAPAAPQALLVATAARPAARSPGPQRSTARSPPPSQRPAAPEERLLSRYCFGQLQQAPRAAAGVAQAAPPAVAHTATARSGAHSGTLSRGSVDAGRLLQMQAANARSPMQLQVQPLRGPRTSEAAPVAYCARAPQGLAAAAVHACATQQPKSVAVPVERVELKPRSRSLSVTPGAFDAPGPGEAPSGEEPLAPPTVESLPAGSPQDGPATAERQVSEQHPADKSAEPPQELAASPNKGPHRHGASAGDPDGGGVDSGAPSPLAHFAACDGVLSTPAQCLSPTPSAGGRTAGSPLQDELHHRGSSDARASGSSPAPDTGTLASCSALLAVSNEGSLQDSARWATARGRDATSSLAEVGFPASRPSTAGALSTQGDATASLPESFTAQPARATGEATAASARATIDAEQRRAQGLRPTKSRAALDNAMAELIAAVEKTVHQVGLRTSDRSSATESSESTSLRSPDSQQLRLLSPRSTSSPPLCSPGTGGSVEISPTVEARTEEVLYPSELAAAARDLAEAATGFAKPSLDSASWSGQGAADAGATPCSLGRGVTPADVEADGSGMESVAHPCASSDAPTAPSTSKDLAVAAAELAAVASLQSTASSLSSLGPAGSSFATSRSSSLMISSDVPESGETDGRARIHQDVSKHGRGALHDAAGEGPLPDCPRSDKVAQDDSMELSAATTAASTTEFSTVGALSAFVMSGRQLTTSASEAPHPALAAPGTTAAATPQPLLSAGTTAGMNELSRAVSAVVRQAAEARRKARQHLSPPGSEEAVASGDVSTCGSDAGGSTLGGASSSSSSHAQGRQGRSNSRTCRSAATAEKGPLQPLLAEALSAELRGIYNALGKVRTMRSVTPPAASRRQ